MSPKSVQRVLGRRHASKQQLNAGCANPNSRDTLYATFLPAEALAGLAPYDGPVLWVAGGDSGYITEEVTDEMGRWFPTNRRVTIKGAGHWVHSEKPEVFLEVLERFLVRGG